MSTNGQLVFTDVDKITFKGVGNASNAVVDTLTGKIGVGVDSPDANLHVLGNSYVSTNLELGGTLIMGTVNVESQHSLEAVTATGNITPLTIEFTNPTTSIVASGNVEVGGNVVAGYLYGDGSNITGISSNLDQIVNIGNVTSNTVQFTNATTGFVTTTNVEVGGELTVSGNVTVDTDTFHVDTATNRVGIGTTTPGRFLEVYTGNGTVPGIRLRRGAGSSYTDLHHVGVNVPSSGDLEGLAIITSDGNATTQEVMRICGNGRVGIGTNNPYTPFEIYTDVGGNSGGGMRIHHVTGSPRLDFVRGGSYRSPNTGVFGASNYADWSIGTGGANFRITRQCTTENSGNEATVMQIQHNGPILSQLSTGWTGNNPNQGDGDDYTASSLYRDYSSWVSIFKSAWVDTGGGWGTFWAGNSGAAYRRDTNDNNPNEYVMVGGGSKRFTFDLDNGHAYFDANLSQSNYDYAEYFEWEDGNPDNEDRRGYSVVLRTGGKITKATSDDEPTNIIGIVSGTSSVIGDAACYDWQGKYEVDEWGTRVTDEVYQLTWTTEEGKNHSYDEDRVPEGVTVPDDVSRRLHNRERIRPEYDASHVYIPRDKRKEWCPVGLLGKVRLRDGCPTNPNWRYMKTVAGKQLWLIR